MIDPNELVQALYRRYGMVVDKDDPVVLAALIYDLATADERQREAAHRDECATVIEAAYCRAQLEGRAAGEKQFAATEAQFFKRLSASGELVCQRMAATGQHVGDRIEQTATCLQDARDSDELAIIIANTYTLMKGAYLAFGSLLLLGAVGLIGKMRGW
jgi:hypothetical protein